MISLWHNGEHFVITLEAHKRMLAELEFHDASRALLFVSGSYNLEVVTSMEDEQQALVEYLEVHSDVWDEDEMGSADPADWTLLCEINPEIA